MIPVGFSLQPDAEFLELCAPLIASAIDYVEIAPETTWFPDERGELLANGYHQRFYELIDAHAIFAVAHGVGFSLGSAMDDGERQARWLARMRHDQHIFGYRWYSDHLGATTLGGEFAVLPMPVPMTESRAHLIQRRLYAMQGITFDVAVENTAFPFVLGDLRDEPEFLRRITAPRGFHLVLDLHNVFVVASNAGISPWSYLESIPWEKVIELHVSGGSTTDVGWLTDDEVLRLDSHDDVIPDPVWQMLEHAVARCANVRGVTLERMEGTVEAGDVPVLREELGRIRWIVERHAH